MGTSIGVALRFKGHGPYEWPMPPSPGPSARKALRCNVGAGRVRDSISSPGARALPTEPASTARSRRVRPRVPMQNPCMSPVLPMPVIALAKIQAPRPRAGLIERPALEQALLQALGRHRLTLLVAPAGYGKTAALTRLVQALGPQWALAWISADDDQVQRFLACLTTALDPYDLPWRVAPEALATLAATDDGLRSAAAEIANALASAEIEQGLIVLDDAHRITDPQVFDLLQMVLDRLPAHWSLVIASRIEPPLSLARWRGLGELAEFRLNELRFTEPEARALLALEGPTPEPAQVSALVERTDGWAAGLRLVATARPRQGGNSLGALTQRHLFDYLASEVLEDMPRELRSFLLRSSILPELSATRCAHVCQLPRSAELLEEVERRGLFAAPLEAPELTLRLHDLFREFLEHCLLREHPDEVPRLLRRAADDEPDLSRAIGYLARAGDWDEAAHVLAMRGPALLPMGGGPVLERLLALFPQAAWERHADLYFLRGLCSFPRLDFDRMADAMQQAATGFRREDRTEATAMALALAYLAMSCTARLDDAARGLEALRAQPLSGEVRTAVGFSSAWVAYAQGRTELLAPLVAEMLSALERSGDPQHWERCFFLCLFAGMPGMRPLLERFAQGASRLISEQPTQLRAGVAHIRCWLAFSDGRIAEAVQWLAQADADVHWLGQPRILMTESWMTHTLIDAVRGDADASRCAAEANKCDIEQHSPLSNRLTHEYEELFTYARSCWMLGDGVRLRAVVTQLAHTGNPHEWAAAPDQRRFGRALVALFEDRLSEARELLQPLACEHDRYCFFPAAQARVLLAYAELRLGLEAEAAATIQPWLAQVLKGAERGGALLAGQHVLQRLAGAQWKGRLPVAQVALLQELADQVRVASHCASAEPDGTPLDRTPNTAPAAGLLTDREREVLEHLVRGDSNKLIARALDLSPHTVKRHVANILGKLGVDTRGQAVHWHSQQHRRS
ncbi:MAG: AAA family ATPase [Burkholderiales bacterium]|nr:AAA family ATPase [Burkholderiales bacterium]